VTDLSKYARQAALDARAVDALVEGFGLTYDAAKQRYEPRSARVEDGVLVFNYWEDGVQLRAEIEVKDDG